MARESNMKKKKKNILKKGLKRKGSQKKRGRKKSKPKSKSNLFCKVSGDVKQEEKGLKKIAKFTKKHSVVVLVGGGSDINNAFKKRGYKIEFCPLGRVFHSGKERKLARKILEKNQAKMQDLFDERGITARVEIPFRKTASVLCPENGDISLLSHYIGFDKLVIFTKKKRVKTKRKWLKKVAKVFSNIEMKFYLDVFFVQ
jgi:hypothetical protein